MTSEELALLTTYATPTEDGRWSFTGYPHSAETALTIIKACQALDVMVTDIVTANAWMKLVNRVIVLEKRLDDNGQPGPHYGSKF
jgi:hypothetical protein